MLIFSLRAISTATMRSDGAAEEGPGSQRDEPDKEEIEAVEETGVVFEEILHGFQELDQRFVQRDAFHARELVKTVRILWNAGWIGYQHIRIGSAILIPGPLPEHASSLIPDLPFRLIVLEIFLALFFGQFLLGRSRSCWDHWSQHVL